LAVYALKHILLDGEGDTMGRILNDYLQQSERANSRSVLEARAAFEQAYGIARQVVELREKLSLPRSRWRRRPRYVSRSSAASSADK
jgi:redox-regulated HSP33 family molecular chaperone